MTNPQCERNLNSHVAAGDDFGLPDSNNRDGEKGDLLGAAEPVRALKGKRAVAVVYSNYPADPRPRRAAEALANEEMALEVICLKETDDQPAHETFNGVEITRIPLKRRRGGKFSYILQYGSFILLAGGILAARTFKRRYHLVHVHNMPDILVFSALIPKLCGAKVILDLHDPMPELMMTIFGLSGGELSSQTSQNI